MGGVSCRTCGKAVLAYEEPFALCLDCHHTEELARVAVCAICGNKYFRDQVLNGVVSRVCPPCELEVALDYDEIRAFWSLRRYLVEKLRKNPDVSRVYREDWIHSC